MGEARNSSPTTAGVYHVPALLRETVDSLVTDPNGIYVDATFGGGGHVPAAGYTAHGAPEEIIKELVAAIQ